MEVFFSVINEHTDPGQETGEEPGSIACDVEIADGSLQSNEVLTSHTAWLPVRSTGESRSVDSVYWHNAPVQKNNARMIRILLDANAIPHIMDRSWLSAEMVLEAPSAEARAVLIRRHQSIMNDMLAQSYW
ncbi:hypothetical protein BO94DRAFT_582944 [Aspergillus sclerotioniger CBS 115572]|uniref:Uncharacterized protein n=1 Tax=Aspergillus sclerotioniger CBS 115572 TaxID=1450535 RepID=A0A317X4R2_9EURO|nr:hypothetical protein BO94DRAFT_582944 [Aspergillus sclerotioniger CBS 115572]PWY93563.1 hypothetical protein BO94DRAFT_582944 [Aspergillus sclerotioniger CBS 115572]